MPEETPPPIVMPARLPPKPVGWGKAILFCVIFYALCAVVEVTLMVLNVGEAELGGSSRLLVQFLFAWPLTLWIACKVSEAPWRESYPMRAFPKLMIVPIVISAFGLSIVLSEMAGWIPTPDIVQEILRNLISGHPVPRLSALAVVPAIAEEMLFRGLIFREFARRYSVRHALFGSAALFALFHLNPWQAVVAFPLGLLAAWLVLRTGSIIPGIILHAGINFTSTFLLMPMGRLFGYTQTEMIEMPHVPWQMLAGGAVFAVGGLVWLLRSFRTPGGPNPKGNELESPYP